MLKEPIPCSQKKCRHYRGVIQPDGTEATEVDSCDAFPDGIPDEITSGKNLHTEPYPGDRNIQYEREPVNNRVLVINEPVENVFCATGPGGGIDPTCPKGGRGLQYHGKIPKDIQPILDKIVAEARERGVDVTATVSIDKKLSGRAGRYIPSEDRIELTSHMIKTTAESSPEALKELDSYMTPGWYGVSRYQNPAATLVHEAGHAAHAANLKAKHGPEKGAELFQKMARGKIKSSDMDTARQVSKYATTNPLEFVAEVYTGRKFGQTYSKEVDDLYTALSGPE